MDKKRQENGLDSPLQMDATGSVDVLLQAAVDFHNTGNLEKAEIHYRQILEIDPKNSNVLHLLGFLAHQLGFGEEGLSLIKEAISYDPDIFLFHSNLAKVCLGLKDTEQAETAYRRCLELESGDLNIMNDLSNLLRMKERGPGTKSLKEASILIKEVVLQKPMVPEYQINFGNIYRDNLQFDKAITCYEKALEIDPEFSGALQNLCVIYQAKEDYKLAKEYANKALKINPKDYGSLNNLAQILIIENKLDEGIEYFVKASELDHNNSQIFINMGHALIRRRRDEEALAAFQKSMEIDNSKPTAFAYFATALRTMDKIEEAENFVREALKQFPDDPVLLNELAVNLQSQFMHKEAEALTRRIVDGNPYCAAAMVTLAIVLIHTGEEEEVLELFKKAFELAPNESTISFNYALSMFCYGHLEEAWQYYRTRWDIIGGSISPVRSFPQDLWDGSSLKGKKIIIYGEQGLGDEIRHASMVPDMLKMGAEVHVECAPRLVDIFQRSFEGAKVFPCPYTDAETGKVALDFQSPILDLGEFIRPTIESFPSDPNHAFLKAAPERIAFWGERLKALGPHPKVGLIWQSSKAAGGRGRWGATVEELAPILSIEGIDFVNLMYTECSDDRATMQELYGVNLHTWDDINLKDDQDDLCALISNLDLVVSHTSSVAYTASGLGIPTFTFMPIMNYFDLLGDADAPGWAPSMRYFRKEIHEDWDATFNIMAVEVRAKLGL